MVCPPRVRERAAAGLQVPFYSSEAAAKSGLAFVHKKFIDLAAGMPRRLLRGEVPSADRNPHLRPRHFSAASGPCSTGKV